MKKKRTKISIAVVLSVLVLSTSLFSVYGKEIVNIISGNNTYMEISEKCANKNWNGNSLKVLGIGNSFTVDSMACLYDIAKTEGIEEIVLGTLYIGGSSLRDQVTNAYANHPYYAYYKSDDATKTTKLKSTMLEAILDEDWDIITLQENSLKSGQNYETYLYELINYINENKTNEECQLVWNLTWPYPNYSQTEGYDEYNNNPLIMYEAIVKSVNKYVANNNNISFFIPSGTAVQNARSYYGQDKLARDDLHLDGIGRLIVGYTWYSCLTGTSIEEISWAPEMFAVTDNDKKIILESVGNALKTPLEITNSSYTK